MRRTLKVSAWVAGGLILLMVLLAGAVLVTGNTAPGRVWIERLTYRLTAGYVKLSGLGCSFPTRLTLDELQLIDREGVWLTADHVSVTWSPLRLLEPRIQVDTLHAARVHMERSPVGDGQGGKASVPDIEVDEFVLPAVELGAPLVGTATTLSLQGDIRLRSLEDANADLVAHRLNGEGEYTLHLRFDPKRMDASLAVHEPASGPLENLLSLPGLGALSATATLRGVRGAEALDVTLAAGGLRARVQGSVDLAHRSAELDYSLTAPAMAPRADVSWAGITLEGNWHGALTAPAATGRLQADELRLAGTTRISKLTANLEADRGKLGVRAVIAGLEIPGPQPKFLGKDPVNVEATLQLDAASRPLDVSATHPLFSLRGHTETAAQPAGTFRAAVELTLPQLAPFAVFTGQDVRGSAVLNGRLVHQQESDALGLDANLALSGGTAAWIPWVGPRVAVQLAGSLSDTGIIIDNLRIAGRASTLAASGSAERTAAGKPTPTQGNFIKSLKARWQLDVADLATLSSDVSGNLKMSGRLGGSPTSLAADADITSRLSVRGSPMGQVAASVHARGLPTAPSGSVQAHGTLDGAPLNLDVAIDRGNAKTFRVQIRQAEWRSAHVEGDMTADAALTQSHGQLALHIAQLGDFDRLLGVQLSGSAQGTVGFVPGQGHTQAQVTVDGKDIVVGRFAGDVHLQARGFPDALGLRLTAELPNLYGAPANLAAAAELNIDARQLKLASASLGYRGETVKVLAPALLSFDKGVSVDDLKLGLRDAVFEIKGQAAPVLDLRASLQRVGPDLMNLFSPGLLAGGTIEAHARLQGTPASPTGRVRVDASDIRFADAAATGLPALALHARAQLDGDSASIEATLAAGSGSQLTASGTVPLSATGPVDMKVAGKLDVGLANPFLEARGMRAAGRLTADATVTGSASAPLVGGGITLAQGSLRDYGRGVNLSDISADVGGDEGGLQIKSFKATASTGSIGMTGTFGVLQPGWPVDLTITARNAQPIASNIVTANLDADVHVSGMARRRIDVAGKIHVNRATIGIPNSLPADVAVLDVRRRGRTAQVATEKQQLIIGLDIRIDAPQQILVQGRGLDAEMGGSIRLTGTTEAPLAAGGFDLQRGSFTLAGNKLTFTQGRVSFEGAGLRKKIDPTLDFTAQTSLADTTATLRITGVADAPRFDFSSSPVLPQDEIMARLLFGQNAAALSGLQAAQLSYALATLTGVGSGGSNPLVKLQKSLGLDRLSVGSNTTTTAAGTEKSDAAIQAGRYITKRVYIEGKQTTAGTSQVQVDVDLTKHLKLQTRLGNGTATTQGTTPENDPGSSVGLSYQFEY